MTSTKLPTVIGVSVTGETRVISLLRREKLPGGDEVVKGRIKKTYFDVTVVTKVSTGGTHTFLFVGHVFKGTPRVIVRPNGTRNDQGESMTYEYFKRWLDQRWGYDRWCRPELVKKEFAKFFGDLA